MSTIFVWNRFLATGLSSFSISAVNGLFRGHDTIDGLENKLDMLVSSRPAYLFLNFLSVLWCANQQTIPLNSSAVGLGPSSNSHAAQCSSRLLDGPL